MLKRYIPPWDDGLAWVVAAVVLLAAVFLANVPVPVAILLSLVAYLGLALARAREPVLPGRPPPMTDEQAFASAARANGATEEAGKRHSGQRRARRGSINSAIRATPSWPSSRKTANSAPRRCSCKGSSFRAEQLLEDYARLERRNVAAAKPVLERVKSENLPLITKATDDFYQQLHQTDVIEIDTLSERLEYNLSDRLPAIGRGDQ